MRLVSELKLNGHHIVGDNAFSSVQLAHDLKIGKVLLPNLTICKCDYTGTQLMLKKNKGGPMMHFAEYKNLPTEGWG